jgi:acyl-CoA thioester hydrolase/thioesterase-3
MPLNNTEYCSELIVRPDDIDMNNHVHSSKYIDYVLAARYDQMDRCYGFSMNEFIKEGFAWVIAETHIKYKRALLLGDTALVYARLEELQQTTCVVSFRIVKKESGRLCADGYFNYTMIDIKTGRATIVPDWIIERYSLPEKVVQ